MLTTIDQKEIILRLSLTFVAGAILGLNRSEHAHAAGLRTTILVCLAASAAMIQANLLLALSSHGPSLVSMDLMRLPLGILSGMGFIGGGAILKKGDMVRGVTTAATLWFATVMGLCFGGGQIALGLGLLGVGFFVLWAMKWIERRYVEPRSARLRLLVRGEGLSEDRIRDKLHAADFEVSRLAVTHGKRDHSRAMDIDVRWKRHAEEKHTPLVVNELLAEPGVSRVRWEPR